MRGSPAMVSGESQGGVVSYCTECGSELSSNDRYCAKCGTPAKAVEAAQTNPDPPARPAADSGPPAYPEVVPSSATTATGGKSSLPVTWIVVGVLLAALVALIFFVTRLPKPSQSSTYSPPSSTSNDSDRLYLSCDTAADEAIQAMESQGTADVLVIDIVNVRELSSNLDRTSDGVALLCTGKAIVSGGSDRPVRFGARIEGGEAYVFMKDS